MKPIIKKYASKDLNIAYNDGYETAIRESKTVGFALKKELSVKEDRKQIAGIIKMNLQLMNMNEMMIQEVADAILFYLMEKKK